MCNARQDRPTDMVPANDGNDAMSYRIKRYSRGPWVIFKIVVEDVNLLTWATLGLTVLVRLMTPKRWIVWRYATQVQVRSTVERAGCVPAAVVGQVNTSRVDVTASPTAKPATGKSQSCQQPVVVVATRRRAVSVIVIDEMSFCDVSHSDYVIQRRSSTDAVRTQRGGRYKTTCDRASWCWPGRI